MEATELPAGPSAPDWSSTPIDAFALRWTSAAFDLFDATTLFDFEEPQPGASFGLGDSVPAIDLADRRGRLMAWVSWGYPISDPRGGIARYPFLAPSQIERLRWLYPCLVPATAFRTTDPPSWHALPADDPRQMLAFFGYRGQYTGPLQEGEKSVSMNALGLATCRGAGGGLAPILLCGRDEIREWLATWLGDLPAAARKFSLTPDRLAALGIAQSYAP